MIKNLEDFSFKKYILQLSVESIIDSISFLELSEIKNFKDSDYNIDLKEFGRGFSFFAKPLIPSKPFIKIEAIQNTKDFDYKVFLGWTKLDKNGNMPDAVSSLTAFREEDELPSIISFHKEQDKDIELKEVLFSNYSGFNRYIFGRDNAVQKMFFFKDKTDQNTKIYNIKKPYYIEYYPNSIPKNVYFFNPDCNDLLSAFCTLKNSDDHPVVLSYFPDGNLRAIDYTGIKFVENIHPSNINFPFIARMRFYLPSYYEYSTANEFGEQRLLKEEYYLGKLNKKYSDIYNALGSYGVNTSSVENIEDMLKQNPRFEQFIREMLGILPPTDAQLDEAYRLSKAEIPLF